VQNDADIVLLDRAVTPVATVPVGTAWRAAHAVAPGGSHVAVSDREEIRLVDRTGSVVWRFPHTPWGTGYSMRGSCGITGDGRTVYATVPETDILFDEYADVAAYDEDSDDEQGTYGDQWIAFDAATGEPTRWWFLDAEATASYALAHPDGVRMALAVGLGQDGARYFLTGPDGSLLASPGENRMLTALAPGRLLTVPSTSPGAATGVALHDDAFAVLVERDIRRPGEWWSPVGGYAGDRILMQLIHPDWTWSRDVLLNSDLEVLGDIAYPDVVSGALVFGTATTWLTSDGTALSGWTLATLPG
jgi:hypothetical protein